MKPLRLIIFSLILLVALNACSSIGSGSDSTRFYSLSALSENSKSTTSSLKLGLGPVRISHHLKRPQIVTRINQNELHVDEDHQWAGSLKEDISQVLIDNLSALLGTQHIEKFPWKRHFNPDYQVRVKIEQLDGTPGGNVTLKARWWLRAQLQADDNLARKSVITVATTSTDYNGYVAALSKAIDIFSHEIASEILKQ